MTMIARTQSDDKHSEAVVMEIWFSVRACVALAFNRPGKIENGIVHLSVMLHEWNVRLSSHYLVFDFFLRFSVPRWMIKQKMRRVIKVYEMLQSNTFYELPVYNFSQLNSLFRSCETFLRLGMNSNFIGSKLNC